MNQDRPILPSDPNDPGDVGGGGGGATPPPTNAYGTQIMQVAIQKKDGDSDLDVNCYLNCHSADDLRFSAYLFVGSQLVQTGTTNLIFDGTWSNSQATMPVMAIIPGVPAGDHIVSLRIKNRENEAALSVLAGSFLKVVELRKAAR